MTEISEGVILEDTKPHYSLYLIVKYMVRLLFGQRSLKRIRYLQIFTLTHQS